MMIEGMIVAGKWINLFNSFKKILPIPHSWIWNF
jgi:hypothetical protein